MDLLLLEESRRKCRQRPLSEILLVQVVRSRLKLKNGCDRGRGRKMLSINVLNVRGQLRRHQQVKKTHHHRRRLDAPLARISFV